MSKIFGAAMIAAAGLAVAAGPALALQTVVTQVDKNTDGLPLQVSSGVGWQCPHADAS